MMCNYKVHFFSLEICPHGEISSVETYQFDFDANAMDRATLLERGKLSMIVYFETNSEHTVPLEVQITFVSKNVRNVVLYGWIILVAL